MTLIIVALVVIYGARKAWFSSFEKSHCPDRNTLTNLEERLNEQFDSLFNKNS